MAKPKTVHADTMMAMRHHTRRRVRCSVRNPVSRGSSKRRKRKPFVSRRDASDEPGDEVFEGAIRAESLEMRLLCMCSAVAAQAARESALDQGRIRASLCGGFHS